MGEHKKIKEKILSFREFDFNSIFLDRDDDGFTESRTRK